MKRETEGRQGKKERVRTRERIGDRVVEKKRYMKIERENKKNIRSRKRVREREDRLILYSVRVVGTWPEFLCPAD